MAKGNTKWGFVGWGSSLPGGAGGYTVPQGVGGIIVGSNDPAAAEVAARARAMGIKVAVMIETPYAEQMSPQQYAQYAASKAQALGADMVVPDIEGSMSHGDPGSASWNWSAETAKLMRQYMPNTDISMTTENHQAMNYGAWTGIGADVWAQAYGSDPMAQQFDPTATYNWLIEQGVPPEQASAVLAPGQTGYGAAVFDLNTLAKSGKNVNFSSAPPGVPRPPGTPGGPPAQPPPGPPAAPRVAAGASTSAGRDVYLHSPSMQQPRPQPGDLPHQTLTPVMRTMMQRALTPERTRFENAPRSPAPPPPAQPIMRHPTLNPVIPTLLARFAPGRFG